MLFGTASFAETPISSLTTDGNVTVIVQKNRLTATIGPINIAATAITEDPDPTDLVLGTGTVTLSGTTLPCTNGDATDSKLRLNSF